MGQGYKLTCDHCTYTEDIYIGIGFYYFSLESIASFVKDLALKQQIEHFQKDPATTFDAYKALYVCPSCNAVRNELFMKMCSDTSQFVTIYTCKRCKDTLRLTPLEHLVPVHLSCPACEHGQLESTFFMDWD